jgi:hypothetical protein
LLSEGGHKKDTRGGKAGLSKEGSASNSIVALLISELHDGILASKRHSDIISTRGIINTLGVTLL